MGMFNTQDFPHEEDEEYSVNAAYFMTPTTTKRCRTLNIYMEIAITNTHITGTIYYVYLF